MNTVELLLKASPVIFALINVVFVIALIKKLYKYKSGTIKIYYRRRTLKKLSLFLLIIAINYVFLQIRWLEISNIGKIEDVEFFWNINETLNAIFNILAILKLYIALNQKTIEDKHQKEINIIKLIKTLDYLKIKYILFFIAFVIIAIIFFILALLGKHEAFSVFERLITIIK